MHQKYLGDLLVNSQVSFFYFKNYIDLLGVRGCVYVREREEGGREGWKNGGKKGGR